MVISKFLTIPVVLFLAISVCISPVGIYAQSQLTPNPQSKMISASGSSVVTVSLSVTVPVSNQTIKTNEGTLKSAIIGLLNSGPNIFKTSDNFQVSTKTKIANQINNATQNVEGIEATNAIVGVEIGKALRSVISPTSKQNYTALITVMASSTCKPASGAISCDNAISMK